ncbi:MAG: hypothetical protein WD512_16610, partial [Candidatus Paceibacterota bacterium]
MCFTSEVVNIKWNNKNKLFYQSKGYIFTSVGDYFEVKLTDIRHNENLMPIEDRVTKCTWCSRSILRLPHEVKNNVEKMCSNECRREWYAKEWSQSEEWKQKSRLRAVKILEDGKISHTESGCQLIVNEILNAQNISYTSEYGFEVVVADNYLNDHNLAIEVMGSYWHCDPRIYPIIEYQSQFERIKHDKRKRKIIKSLSDIDVLYLWEQDITERPELCEELILYYIKNNGNIKNYHSFNYELNELEIFSEKVDIIDSYFEKDIDFLKSIFIPSDGKKKSIKQMDRWLIFNCEFCGEEKEQLKSKYNKSKSHFCSQECKKVSQLMGNRVELGGVDYKCDQCQEKFKVRNYLYQHLKSGKRRHLFCSPQCAQEFSKTGEYTKHLRNRVQKKCSHCNKEYSINYARSK